LFLLYYPLICCWLAGEVQLPRVHFSSSPPLNTPRPPPRKCAFTRLRSAFLSVGCTSCNLNPNFLLPKLFHISRSGDPFNYLRSPPTGERKGRPIYIFPTFFLILTAFSPLRADPFSQLLLLELLSRNRYRLTLVSPIPSSQIKVYWKYSHFARCRDICSSA